MKSTNVPIRLGFAVALAVLVVGAAISAQDRYTLKVPDGLAFSEFKGYEGWHIISISNNGGLVAARFAFLTLASTAFGVPVWGLWRTPPSESTSLQGTEAKTLGRSFDGE